MEVVNESIEAFFNPKGIAIVGVSSDPSKPSSAIFKRLLENKEAGLLRAPLYPVNPKYKEIDGHKVYPSVSAIEGDVDLVVISIPAELTPGVVEDCGRKGVRAAVVISGGFAEAGRRDLEEKLVSTARKYGMRVMGPNTIGLLDPYSGVDTLFLPRRKRLSTGEELESLPEPRPGNLAIITQSGALGEIIMDTLNESGVGIRALIGVGNQADLGVEEFIEYFAEDERTRAILLYLEGVRDGRRFMKSAHKASKKKPIIALKAGKSSAGAKAAFTHTASMVGDIEVYRGMFKQVGIVEARDIEELVDFGKAFSYLDPPKGKRLLVLSNAGGAAVLASDIAPQYGLQLPAVGDEEARRLEELKGRGAILPMVVISNPLDLTGSATNEAMIEAYRALAFSDKFDMHIVIPTHQPPTIDERVIQGIADVAKEAGKPVVGCEMGESEWSKLFRRLMDGAGIPSYPTPERAVRALYGLTLYRRKEAIDLELAEEDRLTWLPRGEMDMETASRVLEEYGIRVPESGFAGTPEDASRIAEMIGFPVVLKAKVAGISHKTDIGGVVVGLENGRDVERAFKEVSRRVSAAGFSFQGAYVQRLVSGVEIILGSVRDEQFGPIITVGVGGVYAELLRDISVRVAPVSKEEALEMLNEIKLKKLLEGFRGMEGVDKGELAELIARFSRILPENPSIEQMEINPLMGRGRELYAVDVRGLIKLRRPS